MSQEEVRVLLRLYVARNVGQGGVDIEYTNWRGERAVRRILPKTDSLRQLQSGDMELQYHAEGEWVFDGYDMERGADRTFSCHGLHSWSVAGKGVWA